MTIINFEIMTYKKSYLKDWLNDHPLIDLDKLKKEANIEHLDFAKLSTQAITSLEKCLMDYGFSDMNGE